MSSAAGKRVGRVLAGVRSQRREISRAPIPGKDTRSSEPESVILGRIRCSKVYLKGEHVGIRVTSEQES